MNHSTSLEYPLLSSTPASPQGSELPPLRIWASFFRWWVLWMETLIAEILQLTACEVR